MGNMSTPLFSLQHKGPVNTGDITAVYKEFPMGCSLLIKYTCISTVIFFLCSLAFPSSYPSILPSLLSSLLPSFIPFYVLPPPQAGAAIRQLYGFSIKEVNTFDVTA